MYSVLLLNGGVGRRAGAGVPKQFVKIKGIPMLVYSLVAIDKHPKINEIILNFPAGHKDEVINIVESWAIKTPVVYVEAGETRHESVMNMLDAAKNKNVFIHEGARPMVQTADFTTLDEHPESNVSLMLPISFTVAPVNPKSKQVTGYIERDSLRNVQLPQKFNINDLRDAHIQAKNEGKIFTEDATGLAHYGKKVYFVEGQDSNFKVTTSLDIHIATQLLELNNNED